LPQATGSDPRELLAQLGRVTSKQFRRVLAATDGNNDSRALVAQFVVDLPPGVADLTVAEFVGACKGMRPRRVRNYLEAADVGPDARLRDLSRAQRAALAGALRLRGGV